MFDNKKYGMLCPLCMTALAPGEPSRYETLDEHVCNPNGSSPVRDTWVCPNGDCGTSGLGTYWAEDGEGPYHTNYDHWKELPWIDGNSCPFNSWWRKSGFQIGYHKDDERLKIGKLTILREVNYRSNDYGHKCGMEVSYRIIWNGVYWMPGIKMLLFVLRCFYREKKHGEEWAIKETKKVIDQSHWPRVKWWRKASRLWIKTFHPAIYRKAEQA
jgi:hypothetical protein